MNLPDDIVYRWLTYDDSQAASWRKMLSVAERERLRGFGHAGRRREFVTGRAAVRTLLSDHLGCAPAAVPLEVTESGALDVQNTPYRVSLAHSGPHAVAVLAERPVGVDVEQIAPRRPDLDRFILHPDEGDLLSALPLDRDRSLILVWTLKEATLKGLQTGFRLSPKKIRLEVHPGAETALAAVDGEARWRIQYAERDSCYWSVATPAGP
ncbi:MAG: 4'-phosphopantetheinyl transferase superfamily protein [Bacteroidetes bacterium]|jgi:4'-phosphopantetheinyl transferase|nr:4'-phosphopantetheinyl transferase superfamily protein [Bacteroidota bacterium]